MKNYYIKKIILIFLILLFNNQSSFCDELEKKIVCINSSELINNLPDYLIAQKKLKKIADIHDMEFRKLIKLFQTKSDKYEKESINKSNIENKKRNEELFFLRKKIEEYPRIASESLEIKQNEFLFPIYKKIENAINKVINKDKTIMRIDDCDPTKGFVLINRGDDITEKILKEIK